MLRLTAAIAGAALASAANSWSVIASNLGTFSTGVSFNADGKTGFLAIGANGVGAEIMKTTDGGNTWASTSDAFELMVLDVTSYGNNVATTGALTAEYSIDGGNTFNYSTVSVTGAGAGQCIRNLGAHDTPSGFAMVGQFGLFTMDDGVAISTDGGATYTPTNITNLVTDARYGAFPSSSVFYVSAGQWPGEGNDQTSSTGTGTGTGSTSSGTGGSTSATVRKLTARSEVVNTKDGMRMQFNSRTGTTLRGARSLQSNSYVAQVMLSTDSGSSWTSVYLNTNAYLNGIDCLDEQRCCVTAENDDTNGFAAILCTWDQGASWNQTYYTNTSGASLLDLRVVGDNGYWAVGGAISSIGSDAGFLYSGDGGQTWTLDTVITGQYVTSVDCAQGTQECWATLIDVTTQAASVAYASTV